MEKNINIEKLIALSSKIAAETAIEKYQQEQYNGKNNIKERKIENTKYLLKEYKRLIEYSNNAIYDTIQLIDELSILDLMGLNEQNNHVESIKNNTMITKLIIEHVTAMINLYGERCMRSDKPEVVRRWEVINYLYLNEQTKTHQEVADIYPIHERTVYKDVDMACEELATLIFGIDINSIVA